MTSTKELLKEVGFYSPDQDLIDEIDYFNDGFIKVFPDEDEVSIRKSVTWGLMVYGKDRIFPFYQLCKEAGKEYNEPLHKTIERFIDAFSESLSKKVYDKMKPKHFIDLFFEYLMSLVIKSKSNE